MCGINWCSSTRMCNSCTKYPRPPRRWREILQEYLDFKRSLAYVDSEVLQSFFETLNTKYETEYFATEKNSGESSAMCFAVNHKRVQANKFHST